MKARRDPRVRVVLFVGIVAVVSAMAIPLGRADSIVDGLPARVDKASSAGEQAVFEGRTIDLSRSWEGAGACVVWPEVGDTECFDTEAALAERVSSVLPETQFLAGGSSAAASSSCGSFLKLYDGTFYSGTSIWFSTRLVWLNLANYGFNQRASSFKIGGCSAYFADYSSGGGAWYPTYLTQAWDLGPTMLSGWNNDVSSIRIL